MLEIPIDTFGLIMDHDKNYDDSVKETGHDESVQPQLDI